MFMTRTRTESFEFRGITDDAPLMLEEVDMGPVAPTGDLLDNHTTSNVVGYEVAKLLDDSSSEVDTSTTTYSLPATTTMVVNSFEFSAMGITDDDDESKPLKARARMSIATTSKKQNNGLLCCCWGLLVFIALFTSFLLWLYFTDIRDFLYYTAVWRCDFGPEEGFPDVIVVDALPTRIG